ncbi:MAG: MFS transporter [Candidatus Daviesbacteria bacterium]|nr:MFS transporter [Candidatus Daviesbacteria bacterium]
MNKKNIFLWTLYDFANSISTIVFFLYFSQWLVIDNGVADIWYNLLFTGGTALLLITAPVVGMIADKVGVRMPFLTTVTFLQFIALLGVSLLVLFAPVSSGVIFLAALLFLFANYFYQFQFVFYNAFLKELAPEKLRGFVSGLGQSFNWLGQISGLLITLPLATGAIVLIGSPGRVQTFLPATIVFFALSLPMILFFKESTKFKKVNINLMNEYKDYVHNFIVLCKRPGLGRFLLGYFFFNDAMITTVNNFPIYLQQVFKVTDTTKSILLMGILVTSAVGAFVSGWISDKIGLKKSLLFILGSWIVIFPLLASTTNFTYFTIVLVALGFVFGSTWTVARAVMVYLSPPEKLNHAFSYYTMFERFSTLVGPLSWGLITLVLVDLGSLRYQIAMASMAIFILIGLFIVKDIPERVSSR